MYRRSHLDVLSASLATSVAMAHVSFAVSRRCHAAVVSGARRGPEMEGTCSAGDAARLRVLPEHCGARLGSSVASAGGVTLLRWSCFCKTVSSWMSLIQYHPHYVRSRRLFPGAYNGNQAISYAPLAVLR